MISKLHFGFYIISLSPYTRAVNKGKNGKFIQISFIVFPDHLLAEQSYNIKRNNGGEKQNKHLIMIFNG